MFASRFWTGFKKAKSGERSRTKKTDTVAEQVKRVLQTSNQQIILMVRS